MRVLQFTKTNQGAAWAYEQARWLSGRGVEVITVLPAVEGDMADRYVQAEMPILQGDFSLPIRHSWRFRQRARALREMVAQVSPDVVHCHFVTNVVMLRLALRNSKTPRVFQVPGPLHLEHWLFRTAEIALATPSDFWAGACRDTCKRYVNAGVPADRVFLNYYGGYGGRSCDEYRADTGVLRREFGLADDSVLIGMVSYFYRPKRLLLQRRGLKGHEDFIDAIALARRSHPEVVGLVIGGPWGGAQRYVDRVKKYARKHCPGGLVFTGHRADLKAVYRELAVAVHPSHSENLGGAAESLAAGVPTVATRVGGFPDIVIDGETGLLVRPKHPEELAGAIVDLIQNRTKASALANRGRELVCELLDIDRTGAAVLDTYRSILGVPRDNA